jgi:hypothetical protein
MKTFAVANSFLYFELLRECPALAHSAVENLVRV